MIRRVTRVTVAAENPRENLTQQRNQHLGSARWRYLIEDKGGSHQSPQPALFAAGSVARLIAVQHGLTRQLPRQFFVRFGYRLAGLFPHLLHRSQTQRYSQYVFQRFQYHPPRHPAGHRQISDQRRQFRPEIPFHFFRQHRRGCLSALCALQLVALIFRDVRFDLRQLCYLMPLRLALRRPRPVSECFLAMAALRGIYGNHCVYPLRWKQAAMMSGVSRLPAGFATALLTLTDASRSLFSRQPVGRRWL